MENFGKIKNAFNSVLVDGIVTKNEASKKLFAKYIKTIRESEILKTQFLIYNNIETKNEPDNVSANIFISENIKFLEKFTPENIVKENEKLINLDAVIKNKINDEYDSKLTNLHEAITKIIFTKRTPKNINEITENTKNIVDYLKDNKTVSVNEVIDLPNSMLTTIMVEKYNAKYSSLDETEKQVLKTLIDSDDEKKKEVYSSTLRECITIIDEKLTKSDLDTKDKLLRVKDKLLNDKQEINENFSKNISKLIELRGNLKNN